jgi:hypothetical protein
VSSLKQASGILGAAAAESHSLAGVIRIEGILPHPSRGGGLSWGRRRAPGERGRYAEKCANGRLL